VPQVQLMPWMLFVNPWIRHSASNLSHHGTVKEAPKQTSGELLSYYKSWNHFLIVQAERCLNAPKEVFSDSSELKTHIYDIIFRILDGCGVMVEDGEFVFSNEED
jgi:hypothetical protein